MARLSIVLYLAIFILAVNSQRGSRKPKKPKDDGKIVGGRDAHIREHPYIVSLRMNNRHFCGGSIISSEWVLTAAHCTDGMNANRLDVTAGMSNIARERPAQSSKVRAIISHPQYSSRTVNNDISLIRLQTPFKLGGNVRAIALDRNEFGPPDSLRIAGWGTMSEGGRPASQLQVAEVPGIDRSTCRSLNSNAGQVTENMVCAGYMNGGVDSCQGDSGGPGVSVKDGRQAGIVSWGQGCARRYRPGVYTNVARYAEWIRRHTGVVAV